MLEWGGAVAARSHQNLSHVFCTSDIALPAGIAA